MRKIMEVVPLPAETEETAAAVSEPKAVPESAINLVDPSLYLNRQISWLAFNERVLNEALSPHWPLLERVKFLAIYHSNLDEFFMIRVAGLHEQLEAAVVENSPDGMSPREQLTRIAQVTRRQVEVATKLFSDELLPALAAANIHIKDW